MPAIKINEVTYYYELHGQGPTVILIAGYTCDHLFWLPVLNDLCQYFQVLIFDNQGVGRTLDNNEPLTAELMAQGIMALARALNLNNPHIVGHSMGGTIAQVIASNYAKKINKLVLLSTVDKWRLAMLNGLQSLLSLRQQGINFDSIFASTIPWIFGQKFLTNQAQVNLFKQSLLNNAYPQSVENQARQFNALVNFNGTSLTSSIKASTLVGYGQEDIVCLPYEAKNLANRIANSTLINFPSAHGITMDAPKELTKALVEFLLN